MRMEPARVTDGAPHVRIEISKRLNVAYVYLSDADIVDTVEVTEAVMVDLDAFGMVVGIEVLRLDAEIPFTVLTETHHVHSQVINLLRLIRPHVGGFVATMTTGTDGAAVGRPVESTDLGRAQTLR